MFKIHIISTILMLSVLVSCVTKKKYSTLEEQNKAMQNDLGINKLKLNKCEIERAEALAKLKVLEDQVAYFKQTIKI